MNVNSKERLHYYQFSAILACVLSPSELEQLYEILSDDACIISLKKYLKKNTSAPPDK